MNSNSKISPVEQELDAIRVRIYEKTKDMTSQEQVDFFNKRTREAFAQYGVKSKIVSAAIVQR
ncbi:MAG: hypothetical protein LBN05_03340 [Oscillospiraceae bacterium]|jgi:hypothetical protein|nr:hypothetical protein [Oscillospiraceae bacterium]